MLSKTTDSGEQDWDLKLPFILFAYRATPQASTGESPFFVLYGRDPRLPTEAAISPPVDREPFALNDYKSLAVDRMSEAWQSANEQITKAQKRQKGQHDRHARPATFKSGDGVFVYMRGCRTGKAYKLSPWTLLRGHCIGLWSRCSPCGQTQC